MRGCSGSKRCALVEFKFLMLVGIVQMQEAIVRLIGIEFESGVIVGDECDENVFRSQ